MALAPTNLTARGGANLGTYNAPVFDAGMTFAEIGQTSLRQYSGWVREEFLPALQGRQAARVYREMSDNNATIGAMLFAISQTIRKIGWRTRPASEAPEALAAAEFADSLREDMSSTWEDFIAEALSMLTYGFSAHEIVYKRRLGPQPEAHGSGEDAPPSSRYNDGRIGIRRLPIRGQDSVIKWFFGVNGQVKGLTQQPYTGPLVDLPIEKLLLFRPSSHKGNPEGRSILRNSYRSWFFLKRFEEEEAIFYERMSGVPCMYVPQELMDAAAAGDINAINQVAAYKRMVTNTKIGEQMGLLLPSNPWPASSGNASNARMFDFQLITPQGRTAVNADQVITRHRLDMLMSVMSDFLVLGHMGHGTQSLAETKVDMFFAAIEGWIQTIAAVLNNYLLPRVWDLNGLDPALRPSYTPDLAKRIDIAALGDFVLKLAQSGMQMFPDLDLENYLRISGGLPEADEGRELLDDEAEQAAEQGAAGQDSGAGDIATSHAAQRTPTPGIVRQSSDAKPQPGTTKPPAGPRVHKAILLALEAAAERAAAKHRAVA